MIAGWVAIGLAASGHSQPGSAESMAAELASLDRAAADPRLGPAERAAAADRAFALRDELLRSVPEDDRCASWMIDQAAAMLSREAARHRDVLLGIPVGRRDGEGDGAAGAHALLEKAEERGAGVLRRLDAATTLTDRESEVLTRLVTVERPVRLPYLRARALLVLAAGAALGPPPEGPPAALARRADELLAGVSLDPGPAEASRLVSRAIAALALGDRAAAAAAMRAFDEARRAGAEPDPGTAEEAALVRLHMAVRTAAPTAAAALAGVEAAGSVGDGAPGPARETLVRAAARALAERAAAARDHATLAEACRLLLIQGEESGPVVAAMLGMRMLSWAEPDRLPARAVLALARSTDAPGGHRPESRADLLLGLLRREDAREVHGPAAEALGPCAADLLERSALGRPGRDLAAEALRRIVECAEASGDAGPKIAAASLGSMVKLAAVERGADLRPLLVRALTLAAASAESRIPDSWRVWFAARLVCDTPEGDAPPVVVYDLLGAVAPDAPEFKDVPAFYAGLLDVLTERAAALGAAARGGTDAARAGALAREIGVLAERGAAWSRRHDPGRAPLFELAAADAATETGSPEGLETYAVLLPRIERGEVRGADPARARLNFARAQLLAGRTEEGFATLRDLAAALDAPPPGAAGPARREEFWHAWALMLEVLGGQNADGSRTGVIRAHVARLRAIDPGLGGPPWRDRIERAAAGAK